ncbi:hypothetical protein [Tropicibacter sp. Alg240-R139]|uniref:hypothetical protein n=1 Tax=Tropicibacter sp. Alg240-R139 TaxID=2305991 RepID=UPI0013DF164C|nr:hypothetical protein [Tropicibacter sp. Alg240-R139]
MFKAAIVLVPSYAAAYLTEKMVYVVPTLAAAGMFAATIDEKDVNRMLDETETNEHSGHLDHAQQHLDVESANDVVD